MFGISSIEFLIIILIGIIVLGPERLPKVIRTVTRWMSQFRRITTELQRAINAEAHLQEHDVLKKEAEQELFGSRPKRKKKDPVSENTSGTDRKNAEADQPEPGQSDAVNADTSAGDTPNAGWSDTSSPPAPAWPEPLNVTTGTGDAPSSGWSKE